MIKVIDETTNEVIKEIPPKKILDVIASMLEMAGLLVDERR
jgi:flagellar protein FlaG